MNEIRVTFTCENEFNKILTLLKANYNIISISKKYRNFKNKKDVEFRVYIKIENLN